MNEYVINVRELAWEDRGVDFTFIGRPSKWGNPFSHLSNPNRKGWVIRVATREEAVARYEEHVRSRTDLMAALDELRGRVLGCWCAPLPCHGDVLVKLLRETEPNHG